MRKLLLLITSAVMLISILGGCSMATKRDGVRPKSYTDGTVLRDKRFANDQKNEMNHIYGVQQNGNNLIGNHKNYRMEMSKEISDRLLKVEGVKSSYVMLTNNNAYVAISLADDNLPHNKMMSRTNVSQMGNQAVDMHKRMNIMATGHDTLTDEVKNKVSKVVKEMRPQTDHVYVSANPDFVGRMKGYATDVSLGHPIQGFITEFNAMVDRVFPAVSGTDASHNRGFSNKGGRILE